MDEEIDYIIVTLPKLPPYKTIRILCSNKNWTPVFEKCNYQQYGKVRYRRYNYEPDKNDRLHCLIQFEDRDVAGKIASDGYIFINDERIEVELMAHDFGGQFLQSPNENSLNDISSSSAFNINGLNDDCLRFTFRKLHISTLLSVSKVCVRFNEIAKEIFRLKYKKKQIRFYNVVMNYPISLLQIEDFLTTFGFSIEKLCITPDEFNFDKYQLNDVLMQINKNCINLKSFDMQKLSVKYKIPNEILPLFSRLESLKIKFDYCKSIDISQSFHALFSGCTQLRDLDIIHSEGITQPTSLPKLTRLTIETSDYKYLRLFSLNNLQLKEISILFTDNTNTENFSQAPNLFRLICEQFANIEKLSIAIRSKEYGTDIFAPAQPDEKFSTNMMQLSELKRLRFLHLFFNDNAVLPLMRKMHQNKIELDSLAIDHGFIDDDAIEIISQMKSISTLKFISSMHRGFYPYYEYSQLSQKNLIQLLKRLPTLIELHIQISEHPMTTTQVMDKIKPIILNGKQLSKLTIEVQTNYYLIYEKEYDELVAIVKKRKNKIKLNLTIKDKMMAPFEIFNYCEMNSDFHLKLKVQYHMKGFGRS